MGLILKECCLPKNDPAIQVITGSFNPVGLAKADIRGDQTSSLNLSENLERSATT